MKRNANFINLKKILIGIVIGCLVVLGFKGNIFYSNTKINEEIEKEVISLGRYVLTTEEVNIYQKELNDFVVVGTVGKDVTLELVDKDQDYYQIKAIGDEDYYVKAQYLVNTDSMPSYDERFKNYIVFNLNVVTDNKTLFYDENDNLVYSFDKSYSLPVIIKDDNRYGVLFNDRLLYIKKTAGELIENKNTDLENTKGIGVLNYHFFYDDAVEEERKYCNQEICASKTQFKMHLDYIKDNGFLTLKMEELEWYIDGKIQLPKSVVITIDDGWRADLGVELLNEYQLNGTVFLVTSWYDPTPFMTDYVEVHSHSDNMHNVGDCPTGQGGGIQCLSRETILNDLRVSSEKLGGTTVFCYPFYEYNDYSISVLKEAGYTMAFAGESRKSDNLVKVGSDKYRLPRFVVVDYTTMSGLAKYLNG